MPVSQWTPLATRNTLSTNTELFYDRYSLRSYGDDPRRHVPVRTCQGARRRRPSKAVRRAEDIDEALSPS